jgi:hypothetical protein
MVSFVQMLYTKLYKLRCVAMNNYAMNDFSKFNETNAKKNNSWIGVVIVLIVVGVLGYFAFNAITKNSTDTAEVQEESLMVVDLTGESDEQASDEENTEDVQLEGDGDDVQAPTQTLDDNDSDFDFSDFSTLTQEVGSEGSSEYTLNSINDSAMGSDGYHRFVFNMEGKDGADELPNVVARYSSSLGSIRVDLNNTTTDNSGIGYQQSESIGVEGITQIYHNISADPTEELYDIGVSSSTSFYLTSEEVKEGEWNIILAVKYPGESDLEVDLGSEEFSMDAQTIDGAGASENAKVTGYSYSASGGVLRVVFLVSGSTDNPIPSVSAGYDASDNLDIWFTDLASNIVPESVDLPSGVTMVRSSQGDGFVYELQGVSGEYKLSATLSPNQVVVEVKL